MKLLPPPLRRIHFWYLRKRHLKRSLSEFRKRDSKENAESTPPEGESIRLVCLWAAELYSPSYTDDLIRSFRTLGWHRRRASVSSNPIGWLEGLHRAHEGGSWMNLGRLVPSISAGSYIPGTAHEVPLPPHVDYAFAGIRSITSSLNCITVCFVFKDDSTTGYSSIYDRTLRTVYRTEVIRTRRGWTYQTPRRQKHERIRQIRRDLSGEALNWFKKHLPGLFSSGILRGQMPTCEFITTQVAEPFLPREEWKPGWIGYLFPLGIDTTYRAWQYSTMPALKLQLFPYQEGDAQYHSILAAKEADMASDDADTPGESQAISEIYTIDRIMDPWLSFWCIPLLLDEYIQSLREIRDFSILSRKASRLQSPMKTLNTFKRYIFQSVDVSAVVGELTKASARLFWPSYDGGAFEPCDRKWYGETTLRDQILRMLHERANWIQTTDAKLCEQLAQYGSLIGAAQNVRTQRVLVVLTVILVIFGVLTVLPLFMK